MPLLQSQSKCSVFLMKISFHSYDSKVELITKGGRHELRNGLLTSQCVPQSAVPQMRINSCMHLSKAKNNANLYPYLIVGNR